MFTQNLLLPVKTLKAEKQSQKDNYELSGVTDEKQIDLKL